MWYTLGTLASVTALPALFARIRLSRAKHRSLTGHARLARRIARLMPSYEFAGDEFFSADDAPDDVVAARRAGFAQMAELYRSRFAASAALTSEAAASISDLEFTSHYRVPFQFSRRVRETLKGGSFAAAADGVTLTDLDGNRLYDLTGSYGVNVFGVDFYKRCIDRAVETARALGPTLGAYHPVVARNAERLKAISGLDEVSFHMSGTEAVMQAVRLARYHTGRSHLVRFCGAYHGWWGDVQPGVGNPQTARDTYTLEDLSETALKVIDTRRNIACVLINPLQALHPNASAPSDSSLVDSSRRAHFDRDAYAAWLRKLREVCDRRGIALIFDEVFVGFRIAKGGAQEYFGVKADLVTYGKTLGGGLPVGAVCGRRRWMRRFRDDRPADICFARGTFNSHPYVMGAMDAFLDFIESPAAVRIYADVERVWNERVSRLNDRLRAEGLPVALANLSSIWTVLYSTPGRYNWMFQYYLRAEGLALSWVGSGRLIFSLDYTDQQFEDVAGRFVAAAQAMRRDGWWWRDERTSNKSIRRRILRELFSHWLASARGRLSSVARLTQALRFATSGSSSSPRSR